jgi:hypothetical protein
MTLARPATLALLATAALAAGCAATSPAGALDPRLPPAQFFNATVEPTRVAPNPQGAARLASRTGCDVIYIARSGNDVAMFALRPTSRMPDAQRCEQALRDAPGVTALAQTQL